MVHGDIMECYVYHPSKMLRLENTNELISIKKYYEKLRRGKNRG
jgi:hypothetical protein